MAYPQCIHTFQDGKRCQEEGIRRCDHGYPEGDLHLCEKHWLEHRRAVHTTKDES